MWGLAPDLMLIKEVLFLSSYPCILPLSTLWNIEPFLVPSIEALCHNAIQERTVAVAEYAPSTGQLFTLLEVGTN
jgi:hypothetical protein